MSASLASPDYEGDLGNGLVRRWSTAADEEKIALCLAAVFRDKRDEPLNQHMINRTTVMFSPGFPMMGPGDFALVEDHSQPERPVVACTCLWSQRWSLGGIPFGLGRPEYVATLEEYRNRGLIRSLFEMVHARSAGRGDLVQAITGIPYYYRQFGYEYALDLGGRRAVPLSMIPPRQEGQPEPYRLRPAAAKDAPHLLALYNERRDASLAWCEVSEDEWRYYITAWELPAVQQQAPNAYGLNKRLYMIVDSQDRVCGFATLPSARYGRTLHIDYLELERQLNWQTAMPSLLRALAAFAEHTPLLGPPGAESKPVNQLGLSLGRSHPAYQMLGEELGAHLDPPYAWYVRVADTPAFVRHIGPVLEGRLANSVLVGHSGELKIDFYRGGLRLQFEGGKLVAAEPWQSPAYDDDAQAGCPGLVFLNLLFGRRSLAELQESYPDIWLQPQARPLLDTLFPKQASLAWPAGYT